MLRAQIIPSAISATVIRNNPSITYANGTFILGPTYGGSVALYRNNAFIPVGRHGGGPGEFPSEIPTFITAARDGSVFVVHDARVTIIDSRAGSVMSSFSLSNSPLSLAVVGKDVVTASFGSREISAFDKAGKPLWKHDAPIKLKQNDLLQLTQSGDSAFWVGSMYNYQAFLMRPDGTVIRSVSRNPSWFRSNGMIAGEPLHARPTPKIAGIVDLGNGLLLFVINVADSAWKPGPTAGMPLDRMRPDEYYDTILEIVDSKDSTLITSTRFDQAIHLVRGSKYVWLLKEASDGDQSFEIFEPHLGR